MELAGRYRDFWADRRTRQSFHPGRVAAGERALWILDQWLPVVVHIDSSTHAVSEPIRLPRSGGPSDIFAFAAGEGAVWAAWPDGLVRIEESDASAIEIPLRVDGFDSLGIGGEAAWVPSARGILRIDAGTGHSGAFLSEIGIVVALRFGHAHLWVLTNPDPAAQRVLLSRYAPDSPATPEHVEIEGTLAGMVIGDDSVWIRCYRPASGPGGSGHSFLIRVDPDSLDVAEYELSDDETFFVVGREVWFGPHTLESNDAATTEVRRVDHTTWKDVGTVRVQGLLSAVSFGPSGIWGLVRRPPTWTLRVCRVDPETSTVVADLDLANVDARKFLPPPPDPIDPMAAENELRDDLARTALQRAVFEEVRLEGSFPHTEVAILFRSSDRPDLRFGYREKIWSDDGVWVTDGATVIAVNLEERIIFEPGLPLDAEPDATGVIWI